MQPDFEGRDSEGPELLCNRGIARPPAPSPYAGSVLVTYSPATLSLVAGGGRVPCKDKAIAVGSCVLTCDRSCELAGGSTDLGPVTVTSAALGLERQLTYQLAQGYEPAYEEVMIDGGEDIRIESPGTGSFGAFDISGALPAFVSVTAPVGTVTVPRDVDFELRWEGGTPASSLYLDMFGDGNFLECGAAADQGELTVPGELLSLFPSGTSLELQTNFMPPPAGSDERVQVFLRGAVLSNGGNDVVDLRLE
jgi:hypothetical protein